MQLFGHPDEDRARDRLKMAFATDAGSEREAPCAEWVARE